MPRQKKTRLKRRKDGRYVCRYKNIWFYGDTEEEALEQREQYKRDESRENSPDVPVLVYADKWLSIYRANVKRHTYNAYAAALETFFEPIKTKTIRNITIDDIAICANGINDFSTHQIKRTIGLVRSIFDNAMETGLITMNPARSKTLKIPQGKTGRGHRAITEEERQLIHNTPHKLRAMYLVMLYAGLRPGEALGLNVSEDVDFSAHIIHVKRSIDLLTANKATVSTGKNAQAIRDVPLLPVLEKEIKNISGLLVPGKNGYMSRTELKLAKQSYKTALLHTANHIGKEEKAPHKKPDEWKKITFTAYDMRHTFCTMNRDAGIDQKVLAAWMGHKDYAMIMRVYDHITDERIENCMQTLRAVTTKKYLKTADSESKP